MISTTVLLRALAQLDSSPLPHDEKLDLEDEILARLRTARAMDRFRQGSLFGLNEIPEA